MILITGCAGYIGQALARALRADGFAVRGLDRVAAADLADLGVDALTADVTNREALRSALQGVEVVFHLAGSPLGSPAEIVRGNVAAAQAVAQECAAHPTLRALVFASSGALYPSGDAWLTEDVPPAPEFHYARAKAEAERVLLDAATSQHVPVLIARIAGVYGPHAPALMLDQVRQGRFPLIGGGLGFASYIHIDDTVTALRALVERGTPGQIYNLADNRPVLICDFYAELARLLGGPPPRSISPRLARLILGVITRLAWLRGRSLPLPPDLVDMAAVSHRMANRRMREELGVMLRYPSYREGLPTCVPPHLHQR
ncbi:NAD-dependent epimerase/dehydratase [Oscillochloris trichoides DG-6]|uniref:NAD-dependent epimerase/dehydratase n=1 Tax=Oscillochloris trichoides DG-6 TaxID=765420 RepID=E1IC82_9CHLR|nr:NAD(P)-dependent oxidoreductase [Oscillochloris trichoides]EFO81199.1 NAD-dependent epimerase/dehydratase [Oscillochloris trichoides DG-6]